MSAKMIKSRRSKEYLEVQSWRERLGVIVLGVAITASFLLGGSNRINVATLLGLRPLIVICLGILLILIPRRDWRGLQVPTFLLAALSFSIGLQLIPLPPSIWVRIPGHVIFTPANTLVGSEIWRPINLTPDRGWISLISLGSPLMALAGLAACRRQDWPILVSMLLIAVMLTAIIGGVQVLGVETGPATLYPNTHFTDAVGLFANRNHQALFLAMGFPLLRCWVLDRPHTSGDGQLWRLLFAGLAALLLIPVILLTGSRSGLLMAGLGILGAVWMRMPTVGTVRRLFRAREHSRRSVALPAILVAIALLLIGAAMLFGRAVAVQRLLTLNVEADRRAETLAVVMQLVQTYWMFGSGFGSFDPLFRVYEPAAILRQSYFNHAHNDLLELIITGGVPATLVLVAFLGWLARSATYAFRAKPASSILVYARLGITITVMALLASLSDYPLRTPALALVIGLAAAWIGKAICLSAAPQTA